MKHLLAIFASLLLGAGAGTAQTGTWHGDLNVQGSKLPLVFHLDEANPTVDSPAQGVKGIPAKVKRIAPDSISVKITLFGASFAGKHVGNEIIGRFSQRGYEFPLTLTPGEEKARRPQTPKPPYPYDREEVSFTNGNAVLSGTLTLPKGYDRTTPVLIMITGSGLQNRDEEIHEHKPFAVIADAMARKGIASLRYDDRGFGQSTGDAANCTTADLKDDALAGVRLLRERFDNVGALGHSEGGTIALMLGADKEVDFIISLAGMITSGKETLLDQNRLLLSQAGLPQETVDEYCRLLALIFDNSAPTDAELDSAAIPESLRQNLRTVIQQVKTPYMQYTINLDPTKFTGKVTCPVLALNGTKDTQVFAKTHLEALSRTLPANPKTEILPMEGLNHLFQTCSTGAVTEYATIEQTIAPSVLDTITRWISGL